MPKSLKILSTFFIEKGEMDNVAHYSATHEPLKVGVRSQLVEVVVKDAYGLPAPLMFVKWETNQGGQWQSAISMSDYLGRASNTYKSSRSGTYKPYCLIKDGSMSEVSRIEFEVHSMK